MHIQTINLIPSAITLKSVVLNGATMAAMTNVLTAQYQGNGPRAEFLTLD